MRSVADSQVITHVYAAIFKLIYFAKKSFRRKDYTIADPSPGSQVTDLNIPDIIGTDNFASDGAWHYEADSSNYNLQQVWDAARKNPNVVIHDWPFLSGSTPDAHLTGYWKCDDNAASSTVTDETGTSNGTWTVNSTQAARNTNNDSTTGVQGNALDSKDLYCIDIPCGSSTPFDNDFFQKGSVLCRFKPQFAYTDSGYPTVWDLGVDSNIR